MKTKTKIKIVLSTDESMCVMQLIGELSHNDMESKGLSDFAIRKLQKLYKDLETSLASAAKPLQK